MVLTMSLDMSIIIINMRQCFLDELPQGLFTNQFRSVGQKNIKVVTIDDYQLCFYKKKTDN